MAEQIQLTDYDLFQIEQMREFAGDDAAEAYKQQLIKIKSLPVQAPVTGIPARQPASPAKTPGLEASAIREEMQTLVDRGMTVEEAKPIAQENVRLVSQAPRKVGYESERLGLPTAPSVEEAKGFMGFLRSFLPKELVSEEEVARAKADIDEQRSQLMNAAKEEAQMEIDAMAVSPMAELPSLEELTSKKFEARIRDLDFSQLAADRYQAITGESPKSPEDITQLARALETDFRQKVAPQVAEKIEEEEKAQLPKAERVKEAAKEYTVDAIKWALESKDETTGRITESPLGAALRDLNGLWQMALDPLNQALTYPVDEEGNVLDTDDFAYKAEKLITSIAPMATATPFLTVPGAGGHLIITAIPRPFQASERTISENPAVETGDYWSQVAAANLRGRFTGDEFMELPLYRQAWESVGMPNAPWWIGLGTEIALPGVTPAGPGLKAISGVASGVGELIEDAAKAGSRTAEVGRLAQGITRYSIRERLFKEATELAPGIKEASINYNEVAPRLAEHIANELVSAAILKSTDITNPVVKEVVGSSAIGKGAIDGLQAKATEVLQTVSFKGGSFVRNFAEKLSDTIAAAKRSGKFNIKELNELAPEFGNYVQRSMRSRGANSIQLVDIYNAGTKVIRDAALENLVNLTSKDHFFLTPTTIISKKLWNEIGPNVTDRTQKIMEGSFEKGNFKAVNGRVIAAELENILGRNADEKAWSQTIDNLRSGKAITPDEYLKAFNLIFEDQARVAGGFKPRFETATTQEMRVPDARKQKGLRGIEEGLINIEELILGIRSKNIAAGIAKSIAGSRIASRTASGIRSVRRPLEGLPSRLPETAPAPVARWINETTEALKLVPQNLKADLIKRIKEQNLTPAQALDAELKAVQGPVSFGDWQNLLKLFFNEHPALTDSVIYRAIGEKGPDMTLENTAAVIRLIREAEPRLKNIGLKKPISGQEALTEGFVAYLIKQRRAKVYRESVANLARENKELILSLKEPIAIPLSTSAERLEKLIGDRQIAVDVARKVDNWSKGLTPAQRFEIAREYITVRINRPFGDITLDELIESPRIKQLSNDIKDIYDRIGRVVPTNVSGASLDAAKREVADIALSNSINTKEIDNFMEKWGLTSGSVPSEIMGDLSLDFMKLAKDSENGLLPIGDKTKKLIEKLTEASSTGNITGALADLRIKDLPLSQYVTELLFLAARGAKRATISGMLGGRVLPNTRFLLTNIITAPLITMTTLGVPDAIRSTGITRLFNWAGAETGLLPKDVVFVDKMGRNWTKEMVEGALARNDISTSQVTFEFSDKMLSDIMNDIRIASNGSPLSKSDKAKLLANKYVFGIDKNRWNEFAERSDNYFRRNVFVTSLMNGKTEQEAADLAKRSLLDYGAIPEKERQKAARYFLFYAFKRQMYLETLAMLIRDPAQLRRLATVHQQTHDKFGKWMMEDDWVKQRLWTRLTEEGIENDIVQMGPATPPVEAFSDMVDVLGFISEIGYAAFSAKEEMGPGEIVSRTISRGTEEIFTPGFELYQEIKNYGPDEDAAGYVPSDIVTMLQKTGTWNWASKAFDIEAVPLDKRSSTRDTFKGNQYRFATKNGYNNYLVTRYVLTRAGFMRSLQDYTRIALKAGVAPEGAVLKKDDQGNWFWFAAGVETPASVPTWIQREDNNLRAIQNELRAMGKE